MASRRRVSTPTPRATADPAQPAQRLGGGQTRLWPSERSPSLPGVYIIIALPAAVTAAVIDQRAVRQQNHPNEYLIQFQPRIDPTLCLFILAVILFLS